MARLKPEYINVKEVPALVESVREAFDSGRTRPASWRRAQLEGIKRMMHERESDISAALYADLGKPAMEAFSAEIQHTEAEADDALSNLDSWMKPRKVKTPMFAQPGKSEIKPEPYGVALIIAPWNYPLSLVMSPLVGAIAAGNAAVIKPSEVAANTSALLAELVPRYLDERCIKVVEGAVPETTALLEQRFDHIFYTGSTSVGRIVMKAAAEHLTPVTLELGGKSPCVVDERIDLKTAARRIAWGKFWNAGQTCIAPDYILAHDRVHDDLVHALEATLREFYGDDPKQSPDYARIINERHFRRLAGLAESGRTVIGGDLDEEQRYISPTVLVDVEPDEPVMGEEIFGPILPVLRVSGADEAIRFINARPKPLALYIFSKDKKFQNTVIERTSSGGVTVNHTLMHFSVPGLPFGGVGESGIGAYHSEASFECFSHMKSVLRKSNFFDPPLVYPPYSESKKRWVKRLL